MGTRPHKRATPILIAALLCSSYLLMAGGFIEVNAQEPSATASTEQARAIQLYREGDLKEAVKALRAVVKQNKDDADAWYYLSLALNRDRDAKGARKALEKTIKLRPNFAPARSGMAYLLLLSSKWREASREAERALALDAEDAEARYVLSVVRQRQGETARALEEIEAALKSRPQFQAALLWKSQVLLGLYADRTDYVANESPEARLQRTKGAIGLLKQAAESLEKYFQLNPSPPNADVWREHLESLRVFAQNVKRDSSLDDSNAERTVFPPSEVTTKARILSRTEPQYTEEARQAQVRGTVVLRAVFGADGTIKNILVLRSLPHGLTEGAVRAARRIKFIPATKDGRPVSQFIQIEYNFNLY